MALHGLSPVSGVLESGADAVDVSSRARSAVGGPTTAASSPTSTPSPASSGTPSRSTSTKTA